MTTIFGIFGLVLLNSAIPVSAASLTLTIPNDPLALELGSATFAESAAKSVTASTSDVNFGYTLSISAKDDNSLKNGSSTIKPIGSALAPTNFSSQAGANTWGYLPSKLNSAVNSNYQPGPTKTASVIEKTSSGTGVAVPYSFKIAAKIDASLPAGKYVNTFVLTLVANQVSYSITYNLNQGSWTGSSPQTGNTVDNTVAISGLSPNKSGYTFQGWCTKSTTNDTCSGDTLQPGNKVTLTNGTNDIQLYAMWKSAQPTTMQDFGNQCSSMSKGDTLKLTDSRDNTQYTIAKLEDDLCWMTDNLRIGSNSQQTVLNSTTSDVASSFTLPVGTTKAGSKTDTSGWHYQQYDTSHIYINSNTNYGGYYTWYAATAGEGTSSKSSGETTHSICPKGWRLPTSAEITTLTSKYNTTTRNNNPPNFGSTVWAGLCDEDGCPRNNGSYGYWWSSTANYSDRAYRLYSASSGFYLGNYYKGYGYSVRCVARGA